MNRPSKYLLIILALLHSNFLYAEGACPSGHYQTTPTGAQGPIGCAPIPTSSTQEPAWAKRWGAIANDGKGNWGIVSDMPSKQKADSAALSECRSRNGVNCKLSITYFNQCAAVITNGVRAITARAETTEKAIKIASEDCRPNNNGQKCWTFYSGCSLPVKIDE